MSQLEEARDQQQQEYTKYDRSVRYNHQRKVWPPPLPQGIYGGRRATERMEMLEGPRGGGTLYYPDSTDYSSFRKSQQVPKGPKQKGIYSHNFPILRTEATHSKRNFGIGTKDTKDHIGNGTRVEGTGTMVITAQWAVGGWEEATEEEEGITTERR